MPRRHGGFWSTLRRWVLGPPGPTSTASTRLGAKGEAVAASRLLAAGYRVLARNARTRVGEADLVMLAPDGVTIVLVEVKSRERSGHARSDAIAPEAALTNRKRRTLRAVARALARANGWDERRVRIDAVAVEFRTGEEPRVRHVEGFC